MDFREFTKIMAFISAAIDKPIARATIDAYYEMLKDMPADLALASAKKVIGSDEYPVLPTIGKIRKAAQDLCQMDRLSAPEAWGLVLKAVHRYGYYGEAEAMASLPDNVGAVAQMMGWGEICHSDKPDVLRAQFMRMYETVEVRQQERDMLPDDVKKVVAGIGRKMLPGVGE